MRYNYYKVILEKQEHKTNRLINSSSPYLRQHAHNPVDWYEWGEEAFEKAKKENKLMIVSIGYSACHWCHVMAHESFEDEETAQIMNENFVCIKIDREELPDVDQTYMSACQLINGNGGWPLNAFTLPDKRPIHALTYHQKGQWQKLMHTLSDLWKNNPQAAYDYADKLQKGIGNMSIAPTISSAKDTDLISNKLDEQFVSRYDSVFGGFGKAPKFPMPNNIDFLIRSYASNQNENLKEISIHTMNGMALGGIYDAVGGGFARYSVDERWFAPHFEKMLYDNAQLIGTYALSASIFKNKFHRQISLDTIRFCENELRSEEGLYYSALDADSEGIEGLFYTYTYEEIENILGADTVFFSQYFQCRKDGNWEHGRNILYAIDTIAKAAEQYEMDESLFEDKIKSCLSKLKDFRNKRIRPGLDDKCICSWNCLILKGISQAALYLDDETLKKSAIELAEKIIRHFDADNELKRIYSKGSLKIEAYLEDHATLIDGLIELYQCTHIESYLLKAKAYSERCLKMFFDSEKGFFRFNSGDALISHKYDTSDDVINSGNSIMAHNLFRLSWYFDRNDWREKSINMVSAMKELLLQSAPWYSNWATLKLTIENGMEQLIISGPENMRGSNFPEKFNKNVNALRGFISDKSEIPLFQHKEFDGKSKIFICKDMNCYAPETI